MHRSAKIGPIWILRLSLGAMYLYSGIDILRHPDAWKWAVRGLPALVTSIIDSIGIDTFLMIQGSVEIILAIALILWFIPKRFVRFVAMLTVLEMAAILIFIGIDAITFRDIAILGSALALFALLGR